MIRSGFWFLSVGATAGATHLAVYFSVAWFFPLLMPEIINFLAFCIAFSVSFIGHRNLSFNDTTNSTEQSLRRFIFVSVSGFACNELVFSILMRLFEWPSYLALLTGFAVAGSQTYLLSRFWAFHRSR